MTGRPSAIGFGFQPWGHHPFGSADWAEEVTWGITPQFIRDDDAKCAFDPDEPFRKYIEAIKVQMQEVKDRYEEFPNLWDANKTPLDQLKSLGFNFDLALDTLIEKSGQVLFTLGDTNATVDLSTLVIDPDAAIIPGTLVLTITNTDGVVIEIRDDEDGNFPVGLMLRAGGTVDYTSGALTGVTEPLLAESTVSVDYLISLKDPELQRSEVLNAIRFFLNKGTDLGYEIAAALSGLTVEVTPLWADTCDTGATLSEAGPTTYFATFNTFAADAIPADKTFTGFFDAWPGQLDWGDSPCRTAQLDLHFSTPDDTEIENFSATAEDVLLNIERVRPIHVRLRSVTFDGPSASGGGWTIPVAAESYAAGGGWTIPVVGEKRAVGGGWTVAVPAVSP